MFKDENRHYSLRKLSVGLASVLIGISFASGNSHTVKADTVKDGSNSTQTVVQTTAKGSNAAIEGHDAAIKIDAKDGANTAAKANAESTPKEQSQVLEVVKKNSNAITQDIQQDAVKTSEAVAKVQNNTVKDNSNETILNAKGSKAAVANMPKEDKAEAKENQNWTDPAKNKLQMSTVKSTTNKKLNAKMLVASKAISQANDTNGGFDSSWGKLDVNDWQGSVQGDYYQLTDYTGDANHIIVPNDADFAKAGISTSGKQVGVTSDLMHIIFRDKTTAQDATVAFSKTDDKQVKAIGTDWHNTWGHTADYINDSWIRSKGKLTKFDGSNLDVANVTDTRAMFADNHISDLSSLANWNVANVINMNGMFNTNQISDLSPLANWNVNNVTDMRYMFYDNQISDLSSLANWKTDNVIHMDWMFYDNQISDLRPLVNWYVDKVTTMSYMFSRNRISNLSPLANWNVNNVTDMRYMFDNNQISDLSSLANWKVAKVTTMSYMFDNNQISDLSPLANWNVNNVTDMSGMFSDNQISDLNPLANWNTGKVTSMSDMFEHNQISDLSPLANWNTGKVTSMYFMFGYNFISNLSPLINWKTDKVTNMSLMFYNNQISDLSPLANWKTDKVTNMSYMFESNQINDLSPLSNWDVANVTDMRHMFDNNVTTQTKTIQAKRVINFVYPDGYTGKKQDSVTQTVDVPQKVNVRLITKDSKPSNNILDWVTKTETPETPDPVYFQDYTVPEIKGLLEPDQTVISKQQADINKPINVTVTYKLADSNTNDAFALDSKNGLHEHANVNDNGGYDADYWGKINVDDWNYTVNGNTIEINGLKYGVSTGANDAVIVPNLDDFKLAGKDGGAKTVHISTNTLGETAKHKYYGLSKTNGNKFVTDSSISNAFYNNSNLTHADLNSLNTNKVTDMSEMFNGASSLKSLDVSKWDTGNVTDMSGMFGGASSLKSLDVSKWDTGNVTNMDTMFGGARSLTGLDVSNWDTRKVTDMGGVFMGASSLTSLDVSNWDTGNVTNMGGMFYGARSLTSLDVSKWDTGNVTNMSMMFNGASKLMSLDVSNWDTSKVTNMSMMFNGASSLHSLDVSKWNTGNVTNMSMMFSGANSLNSLNVLKWDTSKVTNMSLMFNGTRSLHSLDVSKWNTGNVTNMSMMFNGTSSLTSLDVSNWDTSKVTNMSLMFNGASDLTGLDVSNWDTSNVTDMHWMFDGASSLHSLDVSKWKTGNVTNMSYMFNNASSLTSLDVSNWDTSKVTNMSNMFSNASSLALIVNNGKFADYLVNHDSFAKSSVDSGAKSVTTDNTKLLQLLTSDVQHNSATRTIVFTFPADYSPDLTKYHLTKNGNTYQIKQSADYDKSYVQGTVLINATDDITEHHIDTTKPYKLSDTWQPNYDKLVLAHKNANGTVSFDAIQLPKVPGYKAYIVPNKSNPTLFTVSFMAVPTENKPSTPVEATPSKPFAPIAPTENKPSTPVEVAPSKPSVPTVPTDHTSNSAWTDLKHKVVNALNQADSGWTLPADNSTYKADVPVNNATIDLSDLVIAQPVHAQTRTQIHVTKHFKLRKHGKKHAVKHFKHRKKVARTFKKYRL